jgi:hypothetical protein
LAFSADFSYPENFRSNVLSSARSLWRKLAGWREKPVTDSKTAGHGKNGQEQKRLATLSGYKPYGAGPYRT